MRPVRARVPLLAAAVFLALGASGGGASVQPADALPGLERSGGLERRSFVPGEVVVRFRAGASAAARSAALRARGTRTLRSAPGGPTVVEVPEGASVEATAAALERDPNVLFAEPNYVYRLADTVPNDPMLDLLWGLHQASDKDIDAPAAWDLNRGSRDVVVAVIDSGVAYDHPDLAANVWRNDDPAGGGDQDGNGFPNDTRGWDFVQNDRTPFDFNGHGTHVAGTIGAVGNNLRGLTGVSWRVSLMPLRAADASGGLETEDIAAAIRYACREGADVVNGSFSGAVLSDAVDSEIGSADCADVLFVFAAGNSGWNLEGNTPTTNSYPCELHRPAPAGRARPNVVCVAATDSNDALATFSNRGATAVHLAAPGVAIRSTWPSYQVVPGSADGFEGTAAAFARRWGDRRTSPGAALWDRTTSAKRSGSYSLTDSPGANYANNAVTTIRRLGPLDLGGRNGCRLQYHLRLATELGFDFFFIAAGATTATPTIVEAWSGSTGGAFLPFDADLSTVDGRRSAYLRLGLDSDQAVRRDGAYVDDVRVRCLAPGAGGYQSIDGTSMATPHVAGVAALLLSRNPALPVADLKTAILAGVDAVPGLDGQVATGGRLNAATALGSVADAAPPDTWISSAPAAFARATGATFAFLANEPATFECLLDDSLDWEQCTSPRQYADLTQGRHTFRVRATDAVPFVDPSPATHVWTVDTVRPQARITAGPTGTTTARKATVKFRANESGTTFRCKLDRAAWKACTSPASYRKLKRGRHVFQVRAQDRAGNLGPPAKRAWRVT